MISESQYYLYPFSVKQIKGFTSRRLPRKLKKKIITYFRKSGIRKEYLNTRDLIKVLEDDKWMSEYLKNHYNTNPNELPF